MSEGNRQDFSLLLKLHGVVIGDAELQKVEGRGWGLVCSQDLMTQENQDPASLLTIPHDVVLNTTAVETYAKKSRNFRELYDVVGSKGNRHDVLLFLLVQLASPGDRVVSSCWNDYKGFLPHEAFLPTQWTELERELLTGTSLEPAVRAKLLSLTGEFEFVREKSSGLPFWNDLMWLKKGVTLQDWIMLDAWYRSRSLELPKSGHSMVPFLDMVNHSRRPSAYYDENNNDEVVLSVRPGARLSKGDEVTISYGDKSAAEMLFSYGFLDSTSETGSLVLPLEAFPDDPLRMAKLYAFGEQPKIHLSLDAHGNTKWASPFAYLMCVNEEDGLEFRVLQDVQGNREMRVFWQEDDVTEKTKEFKSLIQGHVIGEVLKLRVVTVVQGCLREQLEKLKPSRDLDSLYADPTLNEECKRAADMLRRAETTILEQVVEGMENERTALASNENVVAYLGSMEISQSDLASEEASNEEDDFS